MFIVPITPMKPLEPMKPLAPMEFAGDGGKRQTGHNAGSFRNVLDNAVNALQETQRTSQYDAYQLAFGNVDNLGEIMIHTLKAESMIQTTVQITTRVINAYKEILNIQI